MRSKIQQKTRDIIDLNTGKILGGFRRSVDVVRCLNRLQLNLNDMLFIHCAQQPYSGKHQKYIFRFYIYLILCVKYVCMYRNSFVIIFLIQSSKKPIYRVIISKITLCMWKSETMNVKYSCVILGSSGETGRELINKLASNDSINEVICINRRQKKG